MPNLNNWALLHKRAQIMSEKRASSDRRFNDRRVNLVDVVDDRRDGGDRRRVERRSSEDRRS